MDKVTVQTLCLGNKPTAMTINVPEITSTNIDALKSDVGELETQLGAYLLYSGAETRALFTHSAGAIEPTDARGLRGTKAVFKWYAAAESGGEGQYGSNEIGGVDPAKFTNVGGKMIIPAGTAFDALADAFGAVAVTENGNSVVVYEIELVSRSV